MRLPDPIANTTTEAYLAYKAGVLNIGNLKPSLYDPYLHYDAWLAYWTGLVNTYPVNDDGDPEILTDEEALVAYLSGVTNTYPEEYKDPIDARITGYLRYLVSARFGRPDYPVNNIEFYLSLMKPPIVTNDTPSSNIELDNTAWAELIDVKMYGDTSQQTYTGKNIVPNYLADTTESNITFKKNSDGSITITTSGTASARVEPYLWEKNHSAWPPTAIVLPENTTYYNTTSRDLFWNSISAVDGQSRYHRCPAGETYTTNSAETMNFIYIRVDSGESVNETIYPQLILDSVTDHSYEPYVGNTPAPSPDYPQPVQTVTGKQTVKVHGKNLFNPIDQDYFVNNAATQAGKSGGYDTGAAVELEPNTTYVVTSKTTQVRFRVILMDTLPTTSTGIWGFSGINRDGTSFTSLSFNSASHKYMIINATTLADVQVEKGSTATTFEPYQTQEYAIDLSSKNLLDPTTLIDGYVNAADGSVNSNHQNGEMCSSFIRVKPNTKYTFSIQATSSSWQQWFGIGEYKDCKTSSFILRQSATTAPNSYYTITTHAGCNYVRVSGRNLKDATKIQFEEGDSVTAYEPFWEYKLCGVSDYKDRIYRNADGEWYLHNEIIELRFNGTENWVYDSSFNYFRCPTYPVPNMAAGSGPYQKNNYFTVNNDWGSFMDGDKDSIFTITQDGYRVCIRNNTYNTATAFKTWLASAIPRSYFILQTPTETQITNAALVAQLDALAAAKSYNDKTYITVEATDPNLPALLKVEAGEYR